jgi:glycosyltransferase involved in cell wall biosynthesis
VEIGFTTSSNRTAEILEAADIVLLPYIESFGSGLLLLAMTFGKFIVATQTGGMDEYLARYPRHTLLEGPSSASVADGIARGWRGCRGGPNTVD